MRLFAQNDGILSLMLPVGLAPFLTKDDKWLYLYSLPVVKMREMTVIPPNVDSDQTNMVKSNAT